METSGPIVSNKKHIKTSTSRSPKAISDQVSPSNRKRNMSDPVEAWNERGIYQDCSHLPALASVNSRKDNPLWQSNATKEPKFPVKLHMMLSNPGLEDVIAWLPHGRSFRILNIQKLEQQAIPLYFRHGNYSSFSRQINGWGFKRCMHGPNYQSYYHPLFLRGLPHLCERLKRLLSKQHHHKADKMCAEQPTPDLAAFTKKFPLPQATPLASPEGAIHLPPAFAKKQPQRESLVNSAVVGPANSTSTSSSEREEEAALWKELQALEERKQEILSKRQRRDSALEASATPKAAVPTSISEAETQAKTYLPGMVSTRGATSRLQDNLGAIPSPGDSVVADLLLMQALQANQAYANQGLCNFSLLSAPSVLPASAPVNSAASLAQHRPPSFGNAGGAQLQDLLSFMTSQKK